ncbi:Aste57867_11524 [Aphanomyces stellatus]|uniref:Aste57867_11524 protein n=1 Tax=Aphanomyces stellatus TaxID=120398 RepID=A0A485KTL6_9STRA|nr:hypothetical protein As57867_011481 [Aphanomyces stellatus]VFT88385.1 Aste57867_11524 [Aphanomyces stellatus]
MAPRTTKGERLPLTGVITPPARAESKSWTNKLVLLAVGVTTVLLSVGLTRSSRSAPLASVSLAEVGPQAPLCDTTAQSSGYIKLPKKKDGHLFYWFFESRSNPDTDPLVLWLTGGPGGSSMLALLSENGPCTVAADGVNTISNPYSWTNNANVIWVDQPIGSGFSYGTKHDYDHSSTEAGANMYDFLQGWLKEHPKFAAHPFFVTGESFAGHYAPAVATALLKTKPKAGDVKINLQGVAVGNGMHNSFTQMHYQADYVNHNVYNKTLMSDIDFATYKQNVSAVTTLIGQCAQNDDALACTQAAAAFLPSIMRPLPDIAKVNQYDLRKPTDASTAIAAVTKKDSGSGTKRPMFSKETTANIGNAHVHAFLNNPAIQSRLHVNPQGTTEWIEINSVVFTHFMGDFFRNYEGHVRDLLERGVRVLIYAGDADLVCNWKGNQAWTNELSWSGKAAFQAAAPANLTVDGVAKGVVQSANNFAFARIYNAGHMVPQDQPEAALAMINRFLANAPLQG